MKKGLQPPQNISPANSWVSMRHVQHLALCAREAGLAIDPLLTLVELDEKCLSDGDATVPLQTLELLLAEFSQEYQNAPVGLHMANQIQPTTLGSLGFILQACSTFADMLDVIQRYNGMLSNIGFSSVQHLPGLTQLSWECLAGSSLLKRHLSEYVIGTFVVLARLLAPNTGLAPVSVHMAHSSPSELSLEEEYSQFFRCPVHFDKQESAVIFSSDLMSKRLPSGDVVLKELLEQHASDILKQRSYPGSVVEDVRQLLSALILEGTPTREAVAQHLGISTRSLNRRLQENGTSYRHLLDSLRLDIARQLLRTTSASNAMIAERLGFRSRQSFLRWFSQHTQLTPVEFRRKATKVYPNKP